MKIDPVLVYANISEASEILIHTIIKDSAQI